MKRIMATFTGKDGSPGFKNGEEYLLDIRHLAKSNPLKITPLSDSEPQIGIYPVKGFKLKIEINVYSNIITFLDNWDNIKIVKK